MMEPTSTALKICDVQALVGQLDNLETDDDALEDATSKAAGLLTEIVARMQAIALATKPPTEFEWDRDYFVELSIDDRCIHVLSINPSHDTSYTLSDWEGIDRKRYLIESIARKKIWDSISFEVKGGTTSAPVWLLTAADKKPE